MFAAWGGGGVFRQETGGGCLQLVGLGGGGGVRQETGDGGCLQLVCVCVGGGGGGRVRQETGDGGCLQLVGLGGGGGGGRQETGDGGCLQLVGGGGGGVDRETGEQQFIYFLILEQLWQKVEINFIIPFFIFGWPKKIWEQQSNFVFESIFGSKLK